ncbi:phosphatase PAP2 family protein [Rufibacter ruber]|uniref:phosphatase PAP2 family protein n=1 Tax=Rufibacter ruber TaxID=1783499 RepID=UPI000831B033|nr:phosphatase PAP2 family protein [Rufibacter ruber]
MRYLFFLPALLLGGEATAQTFPADSVQLVDTAQALTAETLPAPAQPGWAKRHRTLLLGTAGALVTAGAGVAAYEWFDEPVKDFTQSKRTAFTKGIAHAVEPFGRAVPLHGTFAVLLSAGVLLKRPRLREAAAVSLGGFYLNALVTQQLKHTFQRYRPSSSLHNNQFEGPEGSGKNGSLPSSHTSNAFAAATAIATVYRDTRWVPPVAYGVAILVGLSRIHDNAHWASDVVAGAAIGYLSAKASFIGYHQARNLIKRHQWRLMPGWYNGTPTLSASVQF